jgi:hypothetical protein
MMETCDALDHAHERGSSIATSNRRTSCSTIAAGSGSLTSVSRVRSPGTRRGLPRSRGPRRSWLPSRRPDPGGPSIVGRTFTASVRSSSRS